MVVFLWGGVTVVCIYSLAFGVTLWRQKNKIGSIAVILLSAGCLVLPYFTYVK
jgi:hypothetical protein